MNNLLKWQIWLLAARPRTLPASMAPVLVGTSLAFSDGRFSHAPALAALVGALLLQLLSNFSNDYFDFQKGADTLDRLGPVRVMAAGLLTASALESLSEQLTAVSASVKQFERFTAPDAERKHGWGGRCALLPMQCSSCGRT